MQLLDYLFYRVALYYEQKWSVSDPQRFGFYIVYAVLTTSIVDVAVSFSLLFRANHLSVLKPFAIGTSAVVFVFCFIRYFGKARYLRLRAKWEIEDIERRMWRRVLLTIYSVIAISFMIVYGILKHNLHWI